MTTDPKNPLPPRLDPTCTCICHSQPGVMHVAPCCREADPIDTEIARLMAELRVYMDAAEAHAVETMRQRDRAESAEAERDAALAQVAGAFEAAAQTLDTAGDSVVTKALGQQLCCSGHHCGCMGADVGIFLQYLIRALTPADALSALSRRDAQMRAEGRKEGLREAAAIAYRVCAETRHVTLGQEAERAILAAAEKGNG